MIIKVCGMRDADNIEQLQQLDIDFMGVIRYPKSKRFASDNDLLEMENVTFNKGTVGVYVNASFDSILKDIVPLQLDVIQLHGDEDLIFTKAFLELGIKVFKAFQITEKFDFTKMQDWVSLANTFPAKLFFLFDTATVNYGGSGKKFNWEQLKSYTAQVPFLLSGGIGRDDVEQIKGLEHPMLLGVDVNSKFESSPGIKRIEEIKAFIKEIKS